MPVDGRTKLVEREEVDARDPERLQVGPEGIEHLVGVEPVTAEKPAQAAAVLPACWPRALAGDRRSSRRRWTARAWTPTRARQDGGRGPASTGSRKHVARARTTQGEVLAASGRLGEAGAAFESAIALAEEMGTPREHWIAQAALARTSYRLGRDEAAEAAYGEVARIIDAIAAGLTTPRLRDSFLAAEPVLAVYHALGRRPPLEETRPR